MAFFINPSEEESKYIIGGRWFSNDLFHWTSNPDMVEYKKGILKKVFLGRAYLLNNGISHIDTVGNSLVFSIEIAGNIPACKILLDMNSN